MSGKPLCIYHHNCADGFGAAWAVWKALGADGVELVAGVHGNVPPDMKWRDVVLVDFSYKREVMEQMSRSARSILVLDHHKSALDDLHSLAVPGRRAGTGRLEPIDWRHHLDNAAQDEMEGAPGQLYAIFDMQRSGAGMAWDFFHPRQPRPRLIDHIEDRDLWRFALPGTREIQAALFSFPYDIATWDSLIVRGDIYVLRREGEAIERKHHKDVDELVAAFKRRMAIGGVEVWVANIPYTLTSDAGHLMADGEPFAACYWDTTEGRVFSLRSREGGADVAEIAKMYGGGGHKNASGFRLPHGVAP